MIPKEREMPKMLFISYQCVELKDFVTRNEINEFLFVPDARTYD